MFSVIPFKLLKVSVYDLVYIFSGKYNVFWRLEFHYLGVLVDIPDSSEIAWYCDSSYIHFFCQVGYFIYLINHSKEGSGERGGSCNEHFFILVNLLISVFLPRSSCLFGYLLLLLFMFYSFCCCSFFGSFLVNSLLNFFITLYCLSSYFILHDSKHSSC